MRFFLLCVLFLAASAEKKAEKKEKKVDLSHGFRTEIDWVKFDKAVGVAKDLNKPIFFLIHKTWCGACKGLRKEFNSSPKMGDLIELSKKFVMVNVEDDEEPEDAKYAPDGGYIPRILFLDTDGEPLTTNNGKRYKNNAYFYPLVNQIVEGMENALKEYSELETKEGDEKDESAAEEPADAKEEENKVTDEEKKVEKTENTEEDEQKEGKEEEKNDKKNEKEDKDEL